MSDDRSRERAKEVRFLKNTFSRPEGRFMLTMGNGSTPDWKLSSLDVLYQTALEEISHEKDYCSF